LLYAPRRIVLMKHQIIAERKTLALDPFPALEL
jgi:hypothetical protein